VAQAYHQGLLSARKADELLYLPPAQQLSELNQILSDRQEVVRRSRIAAGVLRDYIHRGCCDLIALRADLDAKISPRHGED
jgi:hypothetical protein